MAKIKLGSTPKTFKPVTIYVDLPDGSKGDIPLTFRYRTQDEYWEYRDEFFKAVGVERPAGDDTSLPVIAKEARLQAAKHICQAIDSWDLDIELTQDNLCQMFNEIPQSSSAISEAYQSACIQGRLGN